MQSATRFRLRAALVAFLLLAAGFGSAGVAQKILEAPASVQASRQAEVAQARALAKGLLVRENLPGLSVAVGVRGQLLWSEGFGWENIEERVPVSSITRFRIGSVSKLLTSVAVGILLQEGKIDLDAPVQTYVPTFPPQRYPVTTRELMAHTSGIRHYEGTEFLSNKPYASLADGLAMFQNDPLLFKPGTQYHYSSYAWNLVGAIVAAIAKEPFTTFVRERITAPVGMIHTVPDVVKPLVMHRTAYYEHGKDGRLENAPAVDESYKWSSGGYLSTPEDLVQFGYAVLHDRIMGARTRKLLWAPVYLSDGKPTGGGLDWRLDVDADGRHVVSHNGGSVGGTTRFAIYPDQDMVIAVTSNVSDAGKALTSFADQLAGVFAKK